MSSASRFAPVPNEDDEGEARSVPALGDARNRRLKEDKKAAKHKPESLEHAIQIAWCDWAGGHDHRIDAAALPLAASLRGALGAGLG
jgi:hypothetical protein